LNGQKQEFTFTIKAPQMAYRDHIQEREILIECKCKYTKTNTKCINKEDEATL